MNERISRISFAFELLLAIPVVLGAMAFLIIALWPAPNFEHLLGHPVTAALSAVVGAVLLGFAMHAASVFLRHGRVGLVKLPRTQWIAMHIGAVLVAAGAIALVFAINTDRRAWMSLGLMAFAMPALVPYAHLVSEGLKARYGDVESFPPPLPFAVRSLLGVAWLACFAIASSAGLLFAQFPFFEWVAHRDYADCLAFAPGTPVSQLEARFGPPDPRAPGDVDFDPSPGYFLAFSTGIHVRFDTATGRTTDIYCGEGW